MEATKALRFETCANTQMPLHCSPCGQFLLCLPSKEKKQKKTQKKPRRTKVTQADNAICS